MSKPVILTGLRANNDLHIGNYFGALLPIIDMAKSRANEYEINLFVPDLHSFTTPTDLSRLQARIMHNLKLFVAAGLPLDNDNIHIYRQSYVPAHSELTWILSCFTGFGEMSRMTQFKDKSAKIAENRLGVGLFSYPILMAADILLYGAEYVPVGDDQTQHLEFARDIAERMNAMASKYGHEPIFTVPKPVKEQHQFFGKDQGLRIKDLQDPSRKMSKSEESDKGVIFLGDNPDEAAKKVMSAATDSVGAVHNDPENQPGIVNLLQIHALLSNKSLDDAAKSHDGQTSYGDFKGKVAGQIKDFLTDFQAKLATVDESALLAKLESDEQKMNDKANAMLLKVQKVVGLR
jgi:tryptophanyl-tRNA synthetase